MNMVIFGNKTNNIKNLFVNFIFFLIYFYQFFLLLVYKNRINIECILFLSKYCTLKIF